MNTKESLINLMGIGGNSIREKHLKAIESLQNLIVDQLVDRCIKRSEIDAIFGRSSNTNNYDVSIVNFINKYEEIGKDLFINEVDITDFTSSILMKTKNLLETQPHGLKVTSIHVANAQAVMNEYRNVNLIFVIGVKWKGLF